MRREAAHARLSAMFRTWHQGADPAQRSLRLALAAAIDAPVTDVALHALALEWLKDRANPEALGDFADTRAGLELTELLALVRDAASPPPSLQGDMQHPETLAKACVEIRAAAQDAGGHLYPPMAEEYMRLALAALEARDFLGERATIWGRTHGNSYERLPL